MSRVGKRPIAIPKGVEVRYEQRHLHVKGPRGENSFDVPEPVDLAIDDGEMRVAAAYETDADARRMMGTVQAVVANLVKGVSEGFTRRLQLNGVGYRAQVQGSKLELTLGYSHPVSYDLPQGVTAEAESNTLIALSSHDNVLLGRVASEIRSLRPPEPYQGKGVAYENERIRRKAGKTGKK